MIIFTSSSSFKNDQVPSETTLAGKPKTVPSMVQVKVTELKAL